MQLLNNTLVMVKKSISYNIFHMLIILPQEANRQPIHDAHAHKENIMHENSFSHFNETSTKRCISYGEYLKNHFLQETQT